jgi:GH25 family lysozyme M1 (1,4-beta-N-acetylmuramidase)
MIGALRVLVPTPNPAVLQRVNVNSNAGTFQVKISSLNVPSGVQNARVAIWSTANQSDLKWYTATRQSDGTYLVSVNIANHGYNFGTYNAHLYVLGGNGIDAFAGSTTIPLPLAASMKATISATLNTQQTAIAVNTTNVYRLPGVSKVEYAVWGDANGQNDLKWYQAARTAGTNNYRYDVPIANHKEAGKYNVHVYATLTNGAKIFIISATVNVPVAKAFATLSVQNINGYDGSFRIVANSVGTTAPSGVSSARVAVWSASDQSDLKWYAAKKENNGSYTVQANISNHKYNFSTYNAHLYVICASGLELFAGGTTATVPFPVPTVALSNNATQTFIAATTTNAARVGIRKVEYAVWGTDGGQNDIKWYTAMNTGNGVYTYNIPVFNHREIGEYQVHTYATLMNGAFVFLGAAKTNISIPISSNMQPWKGIDVSYWQGPSIDWSAVRASGIRFAVIRAGWLDSAGNFRLDDYFERNVRGARANGILVGTYIYVYAYHSQSIPGFHNSSAMNSLRASGISFDLPVFVDIEEGATLGTLDYNSLTHNVRSMMNELKTYGYRTGFYTSYNWAMNKFNAQQLCDEGFTFWVARWYNNNAELDPYTLGVWPYTTPALWQYRSTGAVGGISGNVDMNYFYPAMVQW